MKRISVTAVVLLALTAAVRGAGTAPGPIDLDEALARQSANDLVSGASTAYDCDMILRTFRSVGTAESPVYLVEVQASGPECDAAILLLGRHGSEKNLVFRRWDPAPDIHEIEPGERGD
jgi:hypothetical protein